MAFNRNVINIKGIRFQPIVNMKTGKVEAWEVLSEVEHPESFFASQTSEWQIAYLMWQLHYLSKRKGIYFVNMPLYLLKFRFLVQQIVDTQLSDLIKLEIHDPESLNNASYLEIEEIRYNINHLHSHGWDICLDDVRYEHIDTLLMQGIHYGIIKIDKSVLNDMGELQSILHRCSFMASGFVIEGVETREQLLSIMEFTRDTNYLLLQGFLWDETKEACTIPSTLDFDAQKIREKCDMIRFDSIKIFIDTDNIYLKHGIYALLASQQKSLLDSYKTTILSANSVSDADVVIRSCEPVDLLNNCVYMHPSIAGTVSKLIFAVTPPIHRTKCIYPCIRDYFYCDDGIDEIISHLRNKILFRRVEKNSLYSSKVSMLSECLNCPCAGIREDTISMLKDSAIRSISEVALDWDKSYSTISQIKRSFMRRFNISSTRDLIRLTENMDDNQSSETN